MSQSRPMSIGVLPQDAIRDWMLAIARGDYMPQSDEPKIWFTSMRTLASVLSDENRELLKTIQTRQPESISALSRLTGLSQTSRSRKLKMLARYNIVELNQEARHKRPIVKATEFVIHVGPG